MTRVKTSGKTRQKIKDKTNDDKTRQKTKDKKPYDIPHDLTQGEIVTKNFFSKGIPLCGVLGGGYNKDFNKLVELHSFLHQSCAKLIQSDE